jgi:hypothetical protein
MRIITAMAVKSPGRFNQPLPCPCFLRRRSTASAFLRRRDELSALSLSAKKKKIWEEEE